MLPKNFIEALPQYATPSDELQLDYFGPDFENWESGVYYGDASGGEFTSYDKLRRIVIAVVCLSHSSDLLRGASSNLPVSVQSVGRGELSALLLLLKNLEHNTQVEFVSDNLNGVKLSTQVQQ